MHGEAIARVSTELARQSSSLLSFKGETRSAVSELKQGLGDLTKTVKALPSTILISSRQERHSADNDNRGSLYDVEGEGAEVIPDIISHQEKQKEQQLRVDLVTIGDRQEAAVERVKSIEAPLLSGDGRGLSQVCFLIPAPHRSGSCSRWRT